jgi:histone acetyltransferase MYST1
MSPAAIHYVSKDGADRESFRPKSSYSPVKMWIGKAHVLDRRPGEVFVHYVGTDKRLDEWVSADNIRATTPLRDSISPGHETSLPRRVNGTSTRKRRRSASPPKAHDARETTQPPAALPTMASTRRNFDKVNFGTWQIKTW